MLEQEDDQVNLTLGDYRNVDRVQVLPPRRKRWQNVTIVNRLASTEGTSAFVVVNEKNQKFVITNSEQVRMRKENV